MLSPPMVQLTASTVAPRRDVERSLCSGFLESVRRFGDRPALRVAGATHSYAEVGERVAALAATIQREDEVTQPLVAVLAHRSLAAYEGVLAALTSGRGYVPLNPKFPIERIRHTLTLSGTTLLVVGPEALPQLHELLSADIPRLTILTPHLADSSALRRIHPMHRFIGAAEMVRGADLPGRVAPPAGSIAYLLFTSGSTGVPKGVPVTHSNAHAYVRTICDRYRVSEHDRFSQMSDLTFDWSIQDLFPCWERGACLVVVPEHAVFAPARIIRDEQITMWASVPSVVTFLQRMHALKPGAFPSIRCSVFCGEPLTLKQAEAWQGATPGALLENLYGPTETTVAVTGYPWRADVSPSECVNGVVPLGWAFDGQEVIAVDERGYPAASGVVGEICIGGAQVTPGYWNDPQRTADRFVLLPGRGTTRWYRTGDAGWLDERGCLRFAGRLDHQVKIRGFRVELQEIDHAVERLARAELAVSVPWPVREGAVEGIVTFIVGATEPDGAKLIAGCKRLLPDYMVPSRTIFVETVPLNVNGKVDRGMLVKQLEQEAT